MAINRVPFNALVDDDGSGNVGTVWNKSQIQGVLLDPIDAEFNARLASGTFTPRIGSSGGGTSVASAALGGYIKAGKFVYVSGRVTLSSKGSLVAGGVVQLQGLPFQCANVPAAPQAGFFGGYYGGLAIAVTSIGGYYDVGGTYVNVIYGAPGGAVAASVLLVSQIADTFDLVFGGSYIAIN